MERLATQLIAAMDALVRRVLRKEETHYSAPSRAPRFAMLYDSLRELSYSKLRG